MNSHRLNFSVLLVALTSSSALGGTGFQIHTGEQAISAMLSAQQFDPPVAQPYALDRAKGEQINYENQMIKPLLVTANKSIAIANEANSTLEVFDFNFNKISPSS